MNLLSTFNTVFSQDVLSRIAMYVDESAEKTQKAVDGLVYTILGGLMKRTTTEIGVNQLYNHIQKGRYDGQLLESLEQTLRDPAHTNTLITHGNEVISHLLPAMKSSIGNMISTYAGIRNSSAISLLGLTTTIVLHVLGKRAKENKLDADGVASLLFAERDAFINAVPDEFMPRLVEKVGLQQIVGGFASPARRTTADIPARVAPARTTAATRPPVTYDLPDDTENDNSSLAKWGVGGLLVLAMLAGGYYIYQNTQNYAGKDPSATEVSSAGNDSAQATDTVARSLAVPVDSANRTPARSTSVIAATTATGVAVGAPPTTAPAGNLTQQMTPYLGNAALPKGRVFPLSGVTFLPGSLSMTAGSQAAIGELATLLKTYPALQIQLIGYANDGNGALTNKSLSFKRVNQIKQQLMSSGIDYLRIDAIGRGTGVTKRDTSGIARPALKKIDLKVVVK